MRPGHQSQPVVVVERLRNVLPKRVSSPAWRDAPSDAVIRVRPQQVAHWSLVRYLLYSVNRPHMIESINRRREPSVEAENLSMMSTTPLSALPTSCESYTTPQPATRCTYLVVNERCQGKKIKQVGEEPPDVGIAVFTQALVVETVHLSNLARFVIAAQDGDAIAVSQLEGDEERDGFNRVVPSVDVVAHEEIICVWRVAADAE
jgi:hypothetical protein